MRGVVILLVLGLAACGPNAVSLSPDQRTVDMARAAMKGGAPQTALQILSSNNANSDGALVLRGDALTALGRYEEARIAYDAVLRRSPRSVGAQIGMGRLNLTTAPAAAEVMFLNAAQLDPRNTTALNDLGVARDLQGHHAAAQQAYRQALGIDPQLSSAMVNLALSMAMTGKGDEAVRMLRPIASSPDASPKMRHDLAAALSMAGRPEEAAQILNADLSPEDVRQAINAYVSARQTTSD